MIYKIFKKFRAGFSEIKICMNRAVTYVNLVNTGMILFLFLSQLNVLGFNINLQKYSIPIFVLLMGGVLFVGWLDTKLKFYHEELKRSGHRHPYFTEILDKVRSIDKRLDKIEGSCRCKGNETSKKN